MNNNRKTHIHMNKFIEATINTYHKKNQIMASKHTLRSFQVSLNFNFVKANFILNSSITSTIYRIIMPLSKKT